MTRDHIPINHEDYRTAINMSRLAVGAMLSPLYINKSYAPDEVCYYWSICEKKRFKELIIPGIPDGARGDTGCHPAV